MQQQVLIPGDQMKYHLIARDIPEIYNGIADRLLREKALPVWHLNSKVLSWIFQNYGEPEIDLFPSKKSAVLPKYVCEQSTSIETILRRT